MGLINSLISEISKEQQVNIEAKSRLADNKSRTKDLTSLVSFIKKAKKTQTLDLRESLNISLSQ